MIQLFTEKERNRFTAVRAGETKAGEMIRLLPSLDELGKTEAPFVLMGFKEDIGIRANLGKAGASNAWDYSIAALLNVQHNRFFDASKLCVAGVLEPTDLIEAAGKLNPSNLNDLQKLRELTAEVDQIVSSLVKKVVSHGKIPIMIGGGHNNAYGNISGSAQALQQKIDVLNIDPHTDYRAAEGRHSGNGFRYARQKDYLGKYFVFGLHEGYNGETILKEFDNDAQLSYSTFEELLTATFEEKDRYFKNSLQWLGNGAIGLELDMDSITRFPVSALNPSGFTLNQIRHYVRTASSLVRPVYFHICEGSPGQAHGENERLLLGKSIAYLITDFIKSYGNL